MGVITAVGDFLFKFGIVGFVLSLVIIAFMTGLSAVTSTPIPISDFMRSFAKFLSISAIGASLVSGVLLAGVSISTPFFKLDTSKFTAIAKFMSIFIPAYTGIGTILSQGISLLGLLYGSYGSIIVSGLQAGLLGFTGFAIGYYLLVKLGFMPDM